MDKCFIDAFLPILIKSEGRRNGMKTVLIIAGIIVFWYMGLFMLLHKRVGKNPMNSITS